MITATFTAARAEGAWLELVIGMAAVGARPGVHGAMRGPNGPPAWV